MFRCGTFAARILALCVCALLAPSNLNATGVPVGGFLPIVGIGLSNEFKADLLELFPAYHTSQPTSTIMLGNGGTPHFDLALLDSGAGFSLMTEQAYNNFNIEGPYSVPGNDSGFAGTKELLIGGATGTLKIDVNDPLGLYASGLQNRNAGPSYSMNLNLMTGQTNTSLGKLPATSDLPNILGLPFISRYATYIRNDQPQFVEVDGRTVRTPAISFLPLGSGGQGIIRQAQLNLNPGAGFSSSPLYLFNQEEDWDFANPWEDPSAPTVLASVTGGAFLNVNASDSGNSLGNQQFLFDTGADVTVVSTLSANFLGYNGIPDFTVAVVGSGGTAFDVPGFFLDQLTVFASNTTNQAANNLVLSNVPVIILNVQNPADPSNIVPGIIGTNVISGRNVVFDPKPGSSPIPSLYISDPVTNQKNWTSTAASGTFGTDGNWSGSSTPNDLSITNVRYVSGTNQTAVVAANTTVWELNVSGTSNNTMTVQVQNGVTLRTFSGINIELGGAIELQNATLDTQFVEMLSGTLTGSGTIETGSGPIPGQVENRAGTIAPGNGIGELGIVGRFANGPDGIVAMQLGGDAVGQYDQIIVDGGVTLDGTLNVSLVNSFAPSVNDSFTLIDSTGDFAGEFHNLQLPLGYEWDVAYALGELVLTVLSVPSSGDFNADGVVDAADYVLWRHGAALPGGYTAWQTEFGTSGGGGADGGSASNARGGVPEPASAALALLAACGLAFYSKRATRPVRSVRSRSCEASSAT